MLPDVRIRQAGVSVAAAREHPQNNELHMLSHFRSIKLSWFMRFFRRGAVIVAEWRLARKFPGFR